MLHMWNASTIKGGRKALKRTFYHVRDHTCGLKGGRFTSIFHTFLDP